MTIAAPGAPRRTPRELTPGLEPSDRLFQGFTSGVSGFVLLITGAVGLFLGLQGIPTFRHYGFSFFTTVKWDPGLDKVGIAGVLLGTAEVALVAMVVAIPLALAMALFISDYAPRWAKAWLVSAVDLMAAVPSIIYGIWGFALLMPHAINFSRWLSQHFGWFPLFHVNTDPNAAVWQQSQYTGSAFIAGLAVSMMAIPLACSVMRAVFDQAPLGEREAAAALGGTRWGVVKTVVLPFGKGGIIGGSMLALGRALGETAAVAIILEPGFVLSSHILQSSSAQTTSKLIAEDFGNASKSQLSALLAAGFVLFVITLLVNSTAALIIGRSRSGAATEI